MEATPVDTQPRQPESGVSGSPNRLKEAILSPDTFCVTWEQIPGRGAFEKQQQEILDNAAKAAARGRIHALSITDNPGGNPAISTEVLSAEVLKLGIEPLVHVACRDRNRNQLESLLYGLTAAGVRNVLVLTGDYPSNEGFGGRAKPVFDLDPTHLLQFIVEMNKGLEFAVAGKKRALAPTDFFAGVGTSPFKATEPELMGQYSKLSKKLRSGAKFVISQVGYDARKLHELLLWLKLYGNSTPAIANIYVLSAGAARTMNANQVPGCVVTDKLVAQTGEEAKAKDRGRAARLLRAARMYAIAKGMGYSGAHIGGLALTYDNLASIIQQGEELTKDWQALVAEFEYPQENGFYFFKRDDATGLNLSAPAERTHKAAVPLIYRVSRLAHALVFSPDKGLFGALKPVARKLDKSPQATKVIGFAEHQAKSALYGCMNCGDCALMDIAYICPMGQCPKNQRNSPCGGSYQGWCEVYPNERKCVWVQAYERLKAYGEEGEIAERLTPPCNWELNKTPSWLNFYMGRDHSAKRLGILREDAAPKAENEAPAPTAPKKAPSKKAEDGEAAAGD